MLNPKVSVVMPAYNAERFIKSALDSVLEQSFLFWELIIVNDGSTDHTREIIDSYSLRDNRVKGVSHERNRGLAAARNTGMYSVMGDYVAFLDSDDCWLPDKLEKQVNFMNEFPHIRAVFTGAERIDENGNIIEAWDVLRKKFPDLYVTTSLLIIKRNIVVGSGSAVMIHRSLIDEVGYFDEAMTAAEDWDYWYRISKHTDLVCLPNNLVQIRRHGASLQTDLPNLLIGKLMFIKKARKDLPEELLPELKLLEIKTLSSLTSAYWHSHKFKKSIDAFIELFIKYPLGTVNQIRHYTIRKFSDQEKGAQ